MFALSRSIPIPAPKPKKIDSCSPINRTPGNPMDTGASFSNPAPPAIVPPPEEGSGSSSALLAPGFRFHPTDEELVRYYLKRKIFGRPLRVDAIAEVELYKAEPWDLPAMSRLQSRDMEWYFFSLLDRKYSNRSRTNRATAQGYWKTTGKDRPVRHGPRTVGMKKTLVFHVGRAPRGERTNWVMHEYRLEDDEITRAGIAQDAYVVCRIFQKSGTGPQNGAQYGAPYVEEDWEECDNLVMAVVDGRDSGDGDNMSMGTVPGGTPIVVGTGDEGFLQLADFENVNFRLNTKPILPPANLSRMYTSKSLHLHKFTLGNRNSSMQMRSTSIVSCPARERVDNSRILVRGNKLFCDQRNSNRNQDHGNQQENTGSDGQNSSNYTEDPIFLVEGTFQDNSSDDMKMAGLLDSQICCNGTGRNSHRAGQIQTLRSDNSEFVELNDVLETVNAEYPSSEELVGCFFGAFKGQNSANQGDGSNCSEICRTDVFDTVNESIEYHGPFQTYPTLEDLFLESNDLVNPIASDYPLEGNMTFYDASGDDHPLQENFVQMHNLYSPVADSSGSNLVDDITCYFDCLDDTDTLQFSTLDSSKKLCADSSSNESFAAEVNGSRVLTHKAYTEALEANVGASSNSLKESVSVPPGSPGKDAGNKSFPKRLANMLGSISAPPAYAAGPPATKGKTLELSAPTSTSSIHVTAGVIQIHGFNMMGRAEDWSLRKSGDFGFLLSFGVARNVLGKSEGFEPVTKMQGWTMSLVLRGGLYFFLLAVLFVTMSFKVGMLVF